MKYYKLISLLFIATLGSLFASCEETAVVDEYANWQSRNTEYINSIAQQASINADGKWMKILSFKLNEKDANGNDYSYVNDCYIYCYKEQEGEGEAHPLSTVSVNYRGRLIPTDSHPEGLVFDESYKGVLNPSTNRPAEFDVNGLIVGWQTALMNMKKFITGRRGSGNLLVIIEIDHLGNWLKVLFFHFCFLQF